MILICFLALTISLNSIDASSFNWTNQDDDGSYCNYTFKYAIKNQVGDDVSSDSFECSDNTNTCTYSLMLNKIFTTEYFGIETLNPEVSKKFIDRVNEIADTLQVDYNRSKVKDGNFACSINPGYKVEIILKPKFHVISGDLRARCCSKVSGVCVSTKRPLGMQIPSKNVLDGKLAGTVSCHVTPAADIRGMSKICSEKKLISGRMFDAIGDTLYKTIINTAANRVKTIEHTNIDGNDAWSLGMCWNNLSRDYCKACIHHLVDNIWSECDNAEGAQMWVNDCGLRYSTYPLNGSSFDDSFYGKHLNEPF